MSAGTASTVSTATTPPRSQRSKIESYRKVKVEEEEEVVLATCFESDANDGVYKRLIPSIYVYSSLHGCIDQLIPTSYKILESSIGLSPKSLGMLTFAQKFTQGLFTLISGVVGHSDKPGPQTRHGGDEGARERGGLRHPGEKRSTRELQGCKFFQGLACLFYDGNDDRVGPGPALHGIRLELPPDAHSALLSGSVSLTDGAPHPVSDWHIQ
ncbi:hypothetical protein OIY81_3400 [Cryptosporidium canis]|uniref:Uncharacterized protein n=1 Tax=Cryptosporidium canis TaxID=195482 RepID=A0ABQ8P6Q2_9CRYT|nr:hypothetical protein OIY81_3400 [Cryptosporidium canis]KAJ1609146.1 hypothetical protein OJ252_2285 [Cryptosporidium canis]